MSVHRHPSQAANKVEVQRRQDIAAFDEAMMRIGQRLDKLAGRR